jgi:hypothetical protein
MLLAVFRPKAILECGDMSPLLDEIPRLRDRRVQKRVPARHHQQLPDARLGPWPLNFVRGGLMAPRESVAGPPAVPAKPWSHRNGETATKLQKQNEL